MCHLHQTMCASQPLTRTMVIDLQWLVGRWVKLLLCFSAIRFINGVNKLSHAILGVMKHDPISGLKGLESLLPVGLVWDPCSRGIFFNGQTGHLQLFDLEHSSIIFNVINRLILLWLLFFQFHYYVSFGSVGYNQSEHSNGRAESDHWQHWSASGGSDIRRNVASHVRSMVQPCCWLQRHATQVVAI